MYGYINLWPECIIVILSLIFIQFEKSNIIYPLQSKGGRPVSKMVLRKLSVLGQPTTLDKNRTRAYCAYSSYGCGCSRLLFLSSISLSLGEGLT